MNDTLELDTTPGRSKDNRINNQTDHGMISASSTNRDIKSIADGNSHPMA